MAKGYSARGGFTGGGGMMRQQQQMQQKLIKMQQDMAKAQEDVENSTFTASVGGGAVQATVSGKKQLTDLVIKPDVVDPQDVEMLQDLVLSAVNEALRQAEDAMESSLQSITGGMNIPGLGF
ncbi:MAG: YbaB/EbfC family nucleoid-associated protein [Ruminococcaceae bacterium]|nr:YbaB/EbfC family nucleoid-associated protein [Oscillospiraceae bacterium]